MWEHPGTSNAAFLPPQIWQFVLCAYDHWTESKYHFKITFQNSCQGMRAASSQILIKSRLWWCFQSVIQWQHCDFHWYLIQFQFSSVLFVDMYCCISEKCIKYLTRLQKFWIKVLHELIKFYVKPKLDH